MIANFWASWCDTCAAEVSYLERAQRQLTASGEGTVLGIDYKDVSSRALRYASAHGLTFPNVRDLDGSFAAVYGTVALPETFVLDAALPSRRPRTRPGAQSGVADERDREGGARMRRSLALALAARLALAAAPALAAHASA